VKHDPIIKAAVGELGDPLNMPGRKVRAEFDDDVATGGERKSQAVAVGHGMNSE
jgi:hypothetical protein